MEQMPSELIAFLNRFDDEDYSIVIRRMEQDERGFAITLEITGHSFDESERESQWWLVSTDSLLEFRLESDQYLRLELTEDHPLLLEYFGNTGELYFNGKAADTAKLVVDLHAAHKRLFGFYRPVNRFVNGESKSLLQLLESGSGLLAKGPETLLKLFAGELEEAGVSQSIIGCSPLSVWEKDRWKVRDRQAQALLLGDGFIIADGFRFVQLDNPPL